MRLNTLCIVPLFLSCLILAIMHISCTDRSNPNTVMSYHEQLSLRVSFTPRDYSYASNPLNPCDYWASLHNSALQYYEEYCKVYGWIDSTDNDTIRILAYEYLWNHIYIADSNNQVIYELDSIMSEDRLAEYITPRTLWELPDTLAANYNKALADPHIGYWIGELMTLISDTSVTDIISEITSLETAIIADTAEWSDLQKFTTLITTAVARYSYAYWSDSTRVMWPIDLLGVGWSKACKKPPKTDTHEIVAQDAMGAASGAIAGGVVGAIGGAIVGALGGTLVLPGGGTVAGTGACAAYGAIVGAGASALGGAIINSVTNALEQSRGKKK